MPIPKNTLPIDALYQEFKSSIKDNHLVLESDTGSGKSTRLPLWCTESDGQGNKKRVLVVEPRRVACWHWQLLWASQLSKILIIII